jgi:uncharacterized protein (TIGR02271 family)
MARNYDPVKTKPTSQQIVVGCFHHADDARRAIEALHSHSFAPDQIGAAFREAELAEIGGSSEHDSATWFRQLRHTYDHGREMEPAPAEWPAGEFESSLSRLQIPPERARRLAQDLAPCDAIVTVNAGSRRREAELLLEQNGALIEHEQNLQTAPAPESAPESGGVSTPSVARQPPKPDHIQLFGEELHVHKDKVSSGDVRVRKESLTQMETLQVPVTREHLVVENTDDTGQVDPKNAIRVPLSEERVRVDKDTVLREEYKVRKREITQNESISDGVRKERLLIDEDGGDKHG